MQTNDETMEGELSTESSRAIMRAAAAYMSDAVYLGPDLKAVTAYLQKIPKKYGTWSVAWGPSETVLYNSMFVAVNEQGEYILACEGTIAAIADYLEDLAAIITTAWPYPSNVNANVATGTYAAFDIMTWLLGGQTSDTFIIDFFNQQQPRKIVVTGHSLGGAVANLFAVYFQNQLNYPAQLYSITFAAPTISDYFFSKLFEAFLKNGGSEQWQNKDDIVPMAWVDINGILNSFPNGPKFEDFDWGIPYGILYEAQKHGLIPKYYPLSSSVRFAGPGMGGLKNYEQEVARQHSLEEVYMPAVIPGYKPSPYEEQPEFLKKKKVVQKLATRIQNAKENLGIKVVHDGHEEKLYE